MKNRSFIDSLNTAVEGFIYVVKTQRNMRIHFLLGVLVLIICIYLNLNKTDLILVCGAISLVLICEMFNTAIELTVDLIKDVYHPLARIIKDVSAGAVFVSSVYALVLGYIVFSANFAFKLDESIFRIKQSPWHITFISLILVLLFAVLGKVISKKGTPFKGGMPSGHAAFAFSLWTTIAFLTHEGVVTILALLMAVLIARNRVVDKIHSWLEVFIGAMLGTLTTALVFQILH